MTRPSVTVLALGGTIAMMPGASGGVVPQLTGEMLVAAVPVLREIAHIRTQAFRQLPSAHLQFDDLEALAAAIRQAVAGGARGVVVTQGTDTIEETAFALDLLLGLDAAVVVTGAMRNPSLPGADGPANLLAAVQVAVSEVARGIGCVVVMNDEIHAARFVRKTHTSSPAAFTSPLAGAIGWLREGRVRVSLAPPRMGALTAQPAAQPARVALVTIGLGDDGALVRAAVAAGFDGMVVEATGGGHVAPAVADALEEAARQMPVVLASRAGTGEVLSATYGYAGAEIDLQRRGLVRAGWLDGIKARVLLTLLLRRGVRDAGEVGKAFGVWGGGAQA